MKAIIRLIPLALLTLAVHSQPPSPPSWPSRQDKLW